MSPTTDTPLGRRAQVIDAASQHEYDLVVVGGGIAGAGVARDAAMRGIDTLLVEQDDFASGTTAYTTRIIHGGLRYLEQLEFGLVFESLRERETLADLAPHLVNPLTFVIPQYDQSRLSRLKIRLGMVLYDLLSFGKTMPNHEWLGADAIRDREPALPTAGLDGGFTYHDRQAPFVERLCLETILDAEAHGADVLNHTAATGLRLSGGSVDGLTVRDRLEDEAIDIDSRVVLNATGPWADALVETAGEGPVVRPTKGVHLVVPELTEHALTLPTTDDRVVFVVPWNGRSLVGTTDTDFDGDPSEARATAADVEYLLDQLGRHFPDIGADDVQYTYAGVRPLVASDPDADASAVSRQHEVISHDRSGLYSLVGAKVTPHRAAAEEATDTVAEYLGVDAPSRTAELPLPGGRPADVERDPANDSVREHLEQLYGSRAGLVLDQADGHPERLEPLCEHTDDILAQVTFAVEAEHARRLVDVVFRRCTVGFEACEGRDAVDGVLEHMAELLGWTPEREAAELERYERVLDRRHAWAEERDEADPD